MSKLNRNIKAKNEIDHLLLWIVYSSYCFIWPQQWLSNSWGDRPMFASPHVEGWTQCFVHAKLMLSICSASQQQPALLIEHHLRRDMCASVSLELPPACSVTRRRPWLILSCLIAHPYLPWALFCWFVLHLFLGTSWVEDYLNTYMLPWGIGRNIVKY